MSAAGATSAAADQASTAPAVRPSPAPHQQPTTTSIPETAEPADDEQPPATDITTPTTSCPSPMDTVTPAKNNTDPNNEIKARIQWSKGPLSDRRSTGAPPCNARFGTAPS